MGISAPSRRTTLPPSRAIFASTRSSRGAFAELDQAHELVREFAAMLDTRDATPLPNWLDKLTASRLPVMAGLVKALRKYQQAVAQGITTVFNSGVNEGRITALKLQKRITSGRAGVPLLRHRVILMAHL
ncbi:transposase [Streptomyces sp. NPDC053794]|uniref:transposase n=1 Tax=Streptomyces sp. NPDC053794 TaxID=3154760 RepID=UPI003442EFA6